MNIKSVNNRSFGMAFMKPNFKKFAVEACLEAANESPLSLKAALNSIDTIGRCFDGNIRLRRLSGTDVVVLQRFTGSNWLEKLFGKSHSDDYLYIIAPNQTKSSVLQETADKIKEMYDLYSKKPYIKTENDFKKELAEYIDSVNNIWKNRNKPL